MTSSLTRRRRSTDETNNYANFIQPYITILPNYTTEINPSDATSHQHTLTLQLRFYVRLPEDASRSPNRATNYVVPKLTLDRIVEQDKEFIGAVVRNTLAPPLTITNLNGWMILASVCIVLLSMEVIVAIVFLVVFRVHKYKQL